MSELHVFLIILSTRLGTSTRHDPNLIDLKTRSVTLNDSLSHFTALMIAAVATYHEELSPLCVPIAGPALVSHSTKFGRPACGLLVLVL